MLNRHRADYRRRRATYAIFPAFNALQPRDGITDTLKAINQFCASASYPEPAFVTGPAFCHWASMGAPPQHWRVTPMPFPNQHNRNPHSRSIQLQLQLLQRFP